MKKISKFFIIVALILIIIRITFPVRVVNTPNISFEIDPLFSNENTGMNEFNKRQYISRYGTTTSKTNILHIFYIIILSAGVIVLIEYDNESKKNKEDSFENKENKKLE